MNKILNKKLKFYLKYAVYALALIILTVLVITLFEEEENIIPKKNFINFSEEEYCQRKNRLKYFEYFTKCFLAFFSGCLISESRFLRFGII